MSTIILWAPPINSGSEHWYNPQGLSHAAQQATAPTAPPNPSSKSSTALVSPTAIIQSVHHPHTRQHLRQPQQLLRLSSRFNLTCRQTVKVTNMWSGWLPTLSDPPPYMPQRPPPPLTPGSKWRHRPLLSPCMLPLGAVRSGFCHLSRQPTYDKRTFERGAYTLLSWHTSMFHWIAHYIIIVVLGKNWPAALFHSGEYCHAK